MGEYGRNVSYIGWVAYVLFALHQVPCVYATVWLCVYVSLRASHYIFVCMCLCTNETHLCVCVAARETHTHTSLYVCMCLCARACEFSILTYPSKLHTEGCVKKIQSLLQFVFKFEISKFCVYPNRVTYGGLRETHTKFGDGRWRIF